jgi:hypothetical protein
MDGHETITHCNFAGVVDGTCAGSGRPPSLAGAREQTPPAWAVAMEERIMARFADIARGYRLPGPRAPQNEDAGPRR